MEKEQEYVALKDALPVIKEVLARGGEFHLYPRGVSMLPTIREGRDSVMLSPAAPPYRRADILLYRRDTGVFVLHRVVKVEKDGSLTMRGDNQYAKERGIREDQVIAVVRRYFRDGREVRTDSRSARLACAYRNLTYPARRVLHALGWRIKSFFGGKGRG